MHGEPEDQSAGNNELPVETIEDGEQRHSGSGQNKKREIEDQEDLQAEKPIEQSPNPAGIDDDKASVGGISSLYFNFHDEDGVDTMAN